MKTAYPHIKKSGQTGGIAKLLPVLILALFVVAGTLNKTFAQVHNLSDWNVPPPLPPGATTIGNTTGKAAVVKPIVLALTDIPVPEQPIAPPVRIPVLMAVSETAYPVNSPALSNMLGAEDRSTDIPLPEAPDAPPLPKQTLQDAPAPQLTDLPIPAPPEMPALPKEPASSGQATPEKLSMPLMPDVISLNAPLLPAGDAPIYWSTPAIPPDINIKLKPMPKEKAVKGRRKGKHKFKAKPLRI